MRRLTRLCPLLALCLSQIKLLAACDECSKVNVTAKSTEIHIQNPNNFTITNVTFANGTALKWELGPRKDSISDLDPGVQYSVYFQNINETCCKNITTVPSGVIDIHFSNITTTTITLSWKSNDPNAPNYIYRIVVDGNGTYMSNYTTTVISGLEPGTLYTFTIYPQVAEVEGNANSGSTYTKPNAVSEIHIENINSTTVSLRWDNNDTGSANYTYRICFEKNGTETEVITSGTSITVGDLEPGTRYTFTIFPRANDTEGDPKNASIYTNPSPVTYIDFSNITTQSVNLMWNNSDGNAANYRYRIEVDGDDSNRTQESDATTAVISNLKPGTLYTFIIYPQVAKVEGDPRNKSTYTKPSPVTYIDFTDITTQSVNLMWNTSDGNAANYTYRIVVDGDDDSNRTQESNTTTAIISSLKPGTLYTFTIYPQVAGIVGDPKSRSTYTKPSPVTYIDFTDITPQSVNVMWNTSDGNAANYTYRIVVDGDDVSNRTQESNATTAIISSLKPGTLYTFTIYPQVAEMEGDPKSRSTYTKPSPVTYIDFTDITTQSVNLMWNTSDGNAANYTYRIVVDGDGDSNRTQESNATTAVISRLKPGTLYTFTIYPQIAEMEGDPKNRSTYTKPTAVTDIYFSDITTQSVNLMWNSSDQNAADYRYRIVVVGDDSNRTQESNATTAVINNLEPGTLYTFTIYPQVAEMEGEPKNTSIYTKPSAVSDITIKNISTVEVTLSWSIQDAAASGYTYRIYVENLNFTGENFTRTFPTKTAFIQHLKPGSSYNFSIFAQVNSGKTEGDSRSLSVCTVAEAVAELDCIPVSKQPELNLSWIPPNSIYNSFMIEISNGTLNRTEYYKPEDHGAIMENLSYFANYTVRIVTHSCGQMSSPREKICLTSITDPPVPSEKPTLAVISHNSLKVQFGSFSPINGPLKAYAVIIASEEMKCNNESLKGTYHEFTNKETGSYVAYVKDVERSSNTDHYDIEIGNGVISHGYFNGKLYPLGSYRACVAGFTRINFTDDYISSRESYVAFSDFSEAVVLPQNPDVITGAVVGCILAAAVVAAVVVFIFWKKRRKGGKNNEVPFSPIVPKKSKLIKVENFESYFKKQKADSNCGFAEEYEDLRPVGINQPKFAAELPENKGKNRYNNVLPYDISRVKLSIQNHPTSDYINANYMPGYNSKKEFIAAQGSLPNTVQDFWRMVWEKNIHTIVMLTKCIEQGRTKCEEYWPNKQSKNYGDITVAMTSEIILPEWTIRDFSMENSDSSVSHPVRQFHFTSWPDHGVPETTDLLISFRHLVQDYMKQNPPTPTLVHCSAGVGRTGTFIAIDRLIHQMEMENTVDVYGVVYDLRMHRPLMVQTEEQYVFLNQCVMDIIKSKKEKKADLIYQNTDAVAIYENFRPSPHLGKANGYHV